MVRDEDGSWAHRGHTLAAKQKRAATLASKKDGEYVECITDLLTAADDGAEAEALEALLDCAEQSTRPPPPSGRSCGSSAPTPRSSWR